MNLVSSRQRGPLLLLATAVACSAGIVRLLQDDNWVAVLPVSLLALACLLAVTRRQDLSLGHSGPVVRGWRGSSRGLFFVVLICALPIGVTFHFCRTGTLDVSALLYFVALLLGWGAELLYVGESMGAAFAKLRSSISRRRAELLLLLLLTVLGGILRTWVAHAYAFAHGSVSDEPLVGGMADGLVHGAQSWPLYQLMGGAVSLIQPMALSFLLFGQSMSTFRAPYVAESTLLIPCYYALARQFTPVAPALCASALLALSLWPIMLGSLAFSWLAGPAFQALGLALLVRGIRQERFVSCAAGGAVVALCLYGYIGHRLMPLPVFLAAVVLLLQAKSPAHIRLLLGATFGGGFALLAAPWIVVVSQNTDLWYGDSRDLARHFQASLRIDALAELHRDVTTLGRLVSSLLSAPKASSFVSLAPNEGGLVDAIVACLIVLGVLTALCKFWRPAELFVVSSIGITFVTASVVTPEFVNTYRLNSAIPALFLAVALFLSHAWSALSGKRARFGGAVLLLALTARSGGATVRALDRHLNDCPALTGVAGLLSSDGSENVLLADAVNALDRHQQVFVVSSFLQVWIWTWLYHRPVPIEFAPKRGLANLAAWPVLYALDDSQRRSARLWPPHLGRGQSGVTYFVSDEDAAIFLATAQREYPMATIRHIRSALCPTYTLTAFSLSARQLAAPSN